MNPALEFRRTDQAKTLAGILDMPITKRALEVALLELAYRQRQSITEAVSSLVGAHLDGAREFVTILESLCQPPESKRTLTSINLDPS
jgi:hypothetical protein